MIKTSRRQLSRLLAVSAISAVACDNTETKRAGVPEAVEVVTAYLDQARVRADHNPVDPAFFSCDRLGATEHLRALASYEIIDSESSGDTAYVMVAIKAVARIELAIDSYYEVTPGVSLDTLQWRLLQKPDGTLGICGYDLRAGIGFVRLDHLGSRIRWLDGTTSEALIEAADSIRTSDVSRVEPER